MTDLFSESEDSRKIQAPAKTVSAASLQDSGEEAVYSRAIYCGHTGDIKVTLVDGSSAIFGAVPAGTTLPIRVKQVFATGTTSASVLNLR